MDSETYNRRKNLETISKMPSERLAEVILDTTHARDFRKMALDEYVEREYAKGWDSRNSECTN